jgi:hypothetical protein
MSAMHTQYFVILPSLTHVQYVDFSRKKKVSGFGKLTGLFANVYRQSAMPQCTL